MKMSAEQIKAYLERRLQNIKYNLDGVKDKEEYTIYYAQEYILKTIR